MYISICNESSGVEGICFFLFFFKNFVGTVIYYGNLMVRMCMLFGSRGIRFSHGLWPWKYVREGGAINQWKIC
jgi:hypothetical protein